MADQRMALPSQHDADRTDEANIKCVSGQKTSFAAQLRKTLNTIPAFTCYALPSGVPPFVNEGYADYLALAKDDPLRFGVRSMYLGTATSNWSIRMIKKKRLKSEQPRTGLGLAAKRLSEYGTVKENTAGSTVASNPSAQAMGRFSIGSG
jgi:hypothetical protein